MLHVTTTLARASISRNAFWVQMHGSHETTASFRLPDNVVVVFTSTPGGYGVGSAGLSLPSAVLRHVRDEKRVLQNLLLQRDRQYSATYLPGSAIPNLSLQFDWDDPWCGVRKAPVITSVITRQNTTLRQSKTTIVFNRNQGWSPSMPYAVRIRPDIFRTRLSTSTHTEFTLETFLNRMLHEVRATPKNPLVLYLNTCRTCPSVSMIRAIATLNSTTPGFRGFGRSSKTPGTPTTMKNELARFFAAPSRTKNTVNLKTNSNETLRRKMIQRSTTNAMQQKRVFSPGLAREVQAYQARTLHKNELGNSYISNSNSNSNTTAISKKPRRR